MAQVSKSLLSLRICLKRMLTNQDFPWFSINLHCFPLTLSVNTYAIRSQDLRRESIKFTKIVVTFDSEGVRRSSWALKCVEFRGESISGTFRTIPCDLGVLILKKQYFYPLPKVLFNDRRAYRSRATVQRGR